MFRLLGGGVFGDTPAGLPNSQLAILPGTSHVTLVNRADLLLPMITSFLDAPCRMPRDGASSKRRGFASLMTAARSNRSLLGS